MLFYSKGHWSEQSDQLGLNSDILCVASIKEAQKVLPLLLGEQTIQHTQNSGSFFESHRGFDYIYVKIPSVADVHLNAGNVELYYSKQRLVFLFSSDKMMDHYVKSMKEHIEEPLNLEMVLYQFFLTLTEQDAERLVRIEKKIIKMEDELVDGVQKEYAVQISNLRKKLLVLKRYYETLVDLLEDLQDNRNELISKEGLRLFYLHANRTDRLYHEVLNLRDYVTQVREAYQSQIDISLNQVMKFFTVIAAIFLPLTLVVGWYGMNVSMPEYDFEYSYPIIIGISVVIVVASVAYFKKNKWF